jgi:hypothetical protein
MRRIVPEKRTTLFVSRTTRIQRRRRRVQSIACEDWYDRAYYPSSPRKDPPDPRTGRARVVRGGSWNSRPTVLRASCHNWGYVGYREGDFGFRCAADLPR